MTNVITGGDILQLTIQTIKSHLRMPMGEGSVFKVDDILNVIVCACSKGTSVHQIYDSTQNSPSDGAVRYHINKLELEELEKAINKMLKEHAKDTIPRKKLKLAIDLTYIPYHGKHCEKESEIVRSAAKSGTTHFHAYATIYLILKDKRYTFGIKFVWADDELADVIDFLLKQVEKIGIKIKRLYLDREFYETYVIDYLQKRGFPFIIPIVLRGKSGGIRKLLCGNRSYTTTYTMTSLKNGKKKSVTFKVNIVVKYYKGKYGKQGTEYFGYAVHNVKIPVRETYEEYRKRFGIESSYSLMNITRARTSSRKPTMRLLLVGASLLMVNIWIYIHWKYVSVKRRGGRVVYEWRYRTMICMITVALDEILQPITEMHINQCLGDEFG